MAPTTISTPVVQRSWADIVKSSSATDNAPTATQLDATAAEFVPSQLRSTMKATAEEFTPAKVLPSPVGAMNATAEEFVPTESPVLGWHNSMNAVANVFAAFSNCPDAIIPTEPVLGWHNSMNAVANVFATFSNRPDAITGDPALEFGPKWRALNAAAIEFTPGATADPAVAEFVASQRSFLSINPAFLCDDESDDESTAGIFDKDTHSNEGDKESTKSTIDTSDAEKHSWDKESIDCDKESSESTVDSNTSISGSPDFTFHKDPFVVDSLAKPATARSDGETASTDGDKTSIESTVDTNDEDKESSLSAHGSSDVDKGGADALEAEDILYAMHFPAKLPPGLSLPPWRMQRLNSAAPNPPPAKLPPWRRHKVPDSHPDVAA